MKLNTLILLFFTFILSSIVFAAAPETVTMQSSLEGQIIYEAPLGSYVKKRQLVEQVDPTEWENQLKIDAAKYINGKGFYDSIKTLVPKTISVGEYTDYKFKGEEALAQYKKDKITLKHTKIYAPFDGIISKIYVYPGSGIGDGNDIMTITKI
ncbi:MAG: hypothetical protein GY756_21760 [bacterium]|nr:hypothetical protein [bacterium]